MYWALPSDLPRSGIREILDLALQTPRAIRLETGEPDFPPAPHILEGFVAASRTGHNRYTPTEGIPVLRQALADKIARVNQVSRLPEEILVTPGGLPALYLAFLGTAASGDESLVPDPGWPDYLGGLVSLGIKAIPYPLPPPPHYIPDLGELVRLVTPHTRAVVFNFPGNPTGAVPSPEELEHLVALAESQDLWIISDEVYDQIVYQGPALSPAGLAPDQTLCICSFSKTFALTGWRLGYLAGPHPAIASLTRAAMGTWSSGSEPLQYAGLAALTGPQSIVQTMRDSREPFICWSTSRPPVLLRGPSRSPCWRRSPWPSPRAVRSDAGLLARCGCRWPHRLPPWRKG
ncbi:MAG: aminotransferase class I/II-fold pyridoxal phosphate-dependent enzyme [Thermaerobacter sp.]|nr:aminotransferase class I/II-fold pyridoxal phosphate-dependent enzyme [Thermaerobacter sp.]